jgi:uncharacterized OB-fold protein
LVPPVGELYSWTTTHRAPARQFAHLTPYTVVIVTLAIPEALRVVGRLREANRVPDLSVGLGMRGTPELLADGGSLLVWSTYD